MSGWLAVEREHRRRLDPPQKHVGRHGCSGDLQRKVLAIDEEVDVVSPVLLECRLDLDEAQLMREQRRAEARREEQRRDKPARNHFRSKVMDAHQLSQSTPASTGAASMCTALISQKPACARRTVTRPLASVRARTAFSGSSLLIATTSTFAIGLPRNDNDSGKSPPARIAYG